MVTETSLSTQTINVDLLNDECRATLSSNFAGLNGSPGDMGAVWADTPSGRDLTDLETVLATHDAGRVSDSQKLGSAQATALAQGRDYLQKQLLQAAPDIGAIYTALKAAVDDNADLAQMVTNQQAMIKNAHGWTLDLVTPTALDKQRYILVVQAVIALLS